MPDAPTVPSPRRRLLALALLAGFGISGVMAVRQLREWGRQEPGPFQIWMNGTVPGIPADARILIAAPDPARLSSEVVLLNSRLAPRPCYLLPPGVDRVEDARDWIAAKRLTWVIGLGGREFQPSAAYSRRLDGGR